MLVGTSTRRTAGPIHTAAIIAGAALLILMSAAPTFAQDDKITADLQSIPQPVQPSASDGLTLNLASGSVDPMGRFDLDIPNLDMPNLNLPVDAVGSTLFRLDLSNPACLSGTSTCDRRTDSIDLGLSPYITAKKDSGIDLVLRPRASFRFDDNSSSALVGAVVEIGEDLRRGSDFKTNTWYLFAGADAEALTFSPDGISQLSSGQFHLQDRIIVGDAQAGLGYRIGDADVSLSYLRREAQAEGFSYNEDAAALSFTWKR
ncbi:hypothetical protein ACFFUB_11240 [Algimonas porphyrae]|uniref:Uncharacterized protein n=1 Tax=Algimonas porphyrae TaxID=1128113 RepID=A0ABQ5V4L2_9PROT|nr:hypothetical protein [Algimonas porphyrae]GLQ22015.1 hypothetical protein GCM10007854_29700 [Algimonas porphyrae]